MVYRLPLLFAFFTSYSMPSPTYGVAYECYEPSSGPYRQLEPHACISTALIFHKAYPKGSFSLTQGRPPNSHWLHCPLIIDFEGCVLTIDFSLRPIIPKVFKISSPQVTTAVKFLNEECVIKNNVDGGQIEERYHDGSYIKYTLSHPSPATSNLNWSLGEAGGVRSNLIIHNTLNGGLTAEGNINSSFFASNKKV